jgi:hypothetical protein
MFELALAAGGTPLTGASAYNTFNLYTPGSTGLNAIRVIGGNIFMSSATGNLGGVFTALTSSGSSSFNGGNPMFFQRFTAACSMPTSVGAGFRVQFYVYSPFTCGNINCITAGIQSQTAGSGAAWILIQGQDNSTLVANEIILEFISAAAIPSTATNINVNVMVSGF